MKRLDSCFLGVTPNGRVLPREENIAWRVSYNFARESHPLVKRQRLGDQCVPLSPNACFVSVVEKDALPKRKNKMEDEKYVLEKHREFMSRCREVHINRGVSKESEKYV